MRTYIRGIVAAVTAFSALLSSASAHGPAVITETQRIPFGQRATIDGNLQVVLESAGSGLALHSDPASKQYAVLIQAPAPKGHPKGSLYERIKYNRAFVEVTNGVAAFQSPGQIADSGPGLIWFTAEKTTTTDLRVPDVEKVPFEVIVHLFGVEGARSDGSIAPFGDLDVRFSDEFTFLHITPGHEISLGGGNVGSPIFGEPLQPQNVVGPTPTLAPGEPVNPVLTILAGDDQYEVNNAAFNFQQIPADFFAPGSEPFSGTVCFRGGDDVGPDTTVRRVSDMTFGDPPSSDTVPIEIIGLNLVSCEPIVVNLQDGSHQLWDARVILSPDAPALGGMQVYRTHENGGTFDSNFVVRPTFVFTEVGGGGIVNEPRNFVPDEPYVFDAVASPWIVCPPDEDDFSEFCPGLVDFISAQATLQIGPIIRQWPVGFGQPVIP